MINHEYKWTILKAIFSMFRFFFFAPSDYIFSNSCISGKIVLS